MGRYDIAIIGTGPAGLSAAITTKIRNKNILLLGSNDLSTKIQKAHTIGNYLGLSSISGTDMGNNFKKHIDSMGIKITEEKVSTIYAMGDYFVIQTSNQMYEATAVILATGINLGKLYNGENELLGKGVSYCATCDAPLYKNKKVAIIGFSHKEETEVDYMAEVARKVYYFPIYKEEVNVSNKVEIKAAFCLGHCTEAVSVSLDGIIYSVTTDNAVEFFDKYVMNSVRRL